MAVRVPQTHLIGGEILLADEGSEAQKLYPRLRENKRQG